eukprot:TRINITY_DN6407_c0_g1_i2.p1 TRINITY_DN6407_c0_g1~~TRINITY_DN6407_c0_g1_i2.p1  ORF type:complete len:706 (+),score=123.26 TRINITY_DN6407_c0_g1_i2:134-2251(+)
MPAPTSAALKSRRAVTKIVSAMVKKRPTDEELAEERKRIYHRRLDLHDRRRVYGMVRAGLENQDPNDAEESISRKHGKGWSKTRMIGKLFADGIHEINEEHRHRARNLMEIVRYVQNKERIEHIVDEYWGFEGLLDEDMDSYLTHAFGELAKLGVPSGEITPAIQSLFLEVDNSEVHTTNIYDTIVKHLVEQNLEGDDHAKAQESVEFIMRQLRGAQETIVHTLKYEHGTKVDLEEFRRNWRYASGKKDKLQEADDEEEADAEEMWKELIPPDEPGRSMKPAVDVILAAEWLERNWERAHAAGMFTAFDDNQDVGRQRSEREGEAEEAQNLSEKAEASPKHSARTGRQASGHLTSTERQRSLKTSTGEHDPGSPRKRALKLRAHVRTLDDLSQSERRASQGKKRASIAGLPDDSSELFIGNPGRGSMLGATAEGQRRSLVTERSSLHIQKEPIQGTGRYSLHGQKEREMTMTKQSTEKRHPEFFFHASDEDTSKHVSFGGKIQRNPDASPQSRARRDLSRERARRQHREAQLHRSEELDSILARGVTGHSEHPGRPPGAGSDDYKHRSSQKHGGSAGASANYGSPGASGERQTRSRSLARSQSPAAKDSDFALDWSDSWRDELRVWIAGKKLADYRVLDAQSNAINPTANPPSKEAFPLQFVRKEDPGFTLDWSDSWRDELRVKMEGENLANYKVRGSRFHIGLE